jgi:type I restriction enzyme S subunit
MKQYDSYKKSEVSWIEKVPSHWEFLRAKNMFYRVQRPVRDEDETITCFRDGQVTLRKNRRTEGFTEALQESGYQGIRKGDLVIHQMDAFAGAIGVSDSDGKGTPVYICCLPKSEKYVSYYYAHALRQMARTGFIKSLYRGIRERSSDFRYETFAVQKLPIPPVEEQEAIVEFLDSKTLKIDSYVAERERVSRA